MVSGGPCSFFSIYRNMEECSVVFNEVFIFNPSVIHVGEKPFTCTYPCDSGGTPTICGERFRRSDELTRHRRRHADERPFVCTECSQAFRRADHLSVHFRRHEREALIRSRSVISSESKPVAVPVSKTFISDQSEFFVNFAWVFYWWIAWLSESIFNALSDYGLFLLWLSSVTQIHFTNF